MKLKLQREALLKPLQLITGVVERRQTMPVLANVLMVADERGVSLTGTDLEVELVARSEVPLEEHGETTLPARKLLDICRALPDEASVELTVSGERAQVRSGRSRFTLSTLPATDFPAVPPVQGVRELALPQALLKRLIERTHFAMAQQDVRYYLNGLLLELAPGHVRTVATDGHRLALCEAAVELGGEDVQQVILPRKCVLELLRLLEDVPEAVSLVVGSNHLRARFGTLTFTSKLVDGRFPDYHRVIPAAGDKRLRAEREELRQALTRASILSNEKYRGVRFEMSDGRLRVLAHNPEQEEAEEELEVDYVGEPLDIGFNVGYLLDALGAVACPRVELSLTDANSSCLVQGEEPEGCKYVVMPMRL
jgi:DNA polymerase III subunit beta